MMAFDEARVKGLNHCVDLIGREYAYRFFDIASCNMTKGDLPQKAQELVKEWLYQHKNELQNMWETQRLYKLPPL